MATDNASRVLEIDPLALSARQKEILAQLTRGRGRVLTPYKVWIHSPDLAEPMETMGTQLNKKSSLSPLEVEIAILVVALFWQSDYVIQAHLRHGRREGVAESAIEALMSGRRATFEDNHTQAVYDFAASAIASEVPSDPDFDRYERVLGRQGIAEVLLLIGYYTSVSLAMKMHKVAPAAGA